MEDLIESLKSVVEPKLSTVEREKRKKSLIEEISRFETKTGILTYPDFDPKKILRNLDVKDEFFELEVRKAVIEVILIRFEIPLILIENGEEPENEIEDIRTGITELLSKTILNLY